MGKGRSSRSLDTEQLRKFRKESSPKVDSVFKRQMKITEEILCRLEDRMFSDEFWDAERNTGKFNSELARHAKDLGQSLANLGSLYIRIQKEAKAAADMMTHEEKIQAIVSFAEEMGKLQAMKFLEAMYPVIHNIEQSIQSKNVKRRMKAAELASHTKGPSGEVPDDPPSDGPG